MWFEEGQRQHRHAINTTSARIRARLAQVFEMLLAHDQALLAAAEEDTWRYAGLVSDRHPGEQFAQIIANAAALRVAVAADQARVDGAKLDLSSLHDRQAGRRQDRQAG